MRTVTKEFVRTSKKLAKWHEYYMSSINEHTTFCFQKIDCRFGPNEKDFDRRPYWFKSNKRFE